MNSGKISKRKRVFVCSPLRGDFETNRAIAECLCRLITLLGYIPIAPHVYFTRFLDDSRESERRVGMQSGIELLEDCDELWEFRIPETTEGMAEEVAKAKEVGIPVMTFILRKED